jgi:hypothetical protein
VGRFLSGNALVLVRDLAEPQPPVIGLGLGLLQMFHRTLERSETRNDSLVRRNPVVVIQRELANIDVIGDVSIVRSQFESHIPWPRARIRVSDPALQLPIREVRASEDLAAERVQSAHAVIPLKITPHKGSSPLRHVLVKEKHGENLIVRTSMSVIRWDIIPRLGEALKSRIGKHTAHAITKISPSKKTEVHHRIRATLNSGTRNGNIELRLPRLNRDVDSLGRSATKRGTTESGATGSRGWSMNRSKNIHTRKQGTRDTRPVSNRDAHFLEAILVEIPKGIRGIEARIHQ